MDVNFARHECLQTQQQARQRRAVGALCAAVIAITGCLRAALFWVQLHSPGVSADQLLHARQWALLEGELKVLQAEGRLLDESLHELGELHGLGFPASATLAALSALVSGRTALSSMAISADAIRLLGSAEVQLEVPRLVRSLEKIFPGSCISVAGDAAHAEAQVGEAFEARVEGWRGENQACRKRGGTGETWAYE